MFAVTRFGGGAGGGAGAGAGAGGVTGAGVTAAGVNGAHASQAAVQPNAAHSASFFSDEQELFVSYLVHTLPAIDTAFAEALKRRASDKAQ